MSFDDRDVMVNGETIVDSLDPSLLEITPFQRYRGLSLSVVRTLQSQEESLNAMLFLTLIKDYEYVNANALSFFRKLLEKCRVAQPAQSEDIDEVKLAMISYAECLLGQCHDALSTCKGQLPNFRSPQLQQQLELYSDAVSSVKSFSGPYDSELPGIESVEWR